MIDQLNNSPMDWIFLTNICLFCEAPTTDGGKLRGNEGGATSKQHLIKHSNDMDYSGLL